MTTDDIFAQEIAFLADHYCAVERRVEEWEAAIQHIEGHAPHVDTRVRDAWDGLDLEGLARGILTGGEQRG